LQHFSERARFRVAVEHYKEFFEKFQEKKRKKRRIPSFNAKKRPFYKR